jgi:hypothetical protein
MESERRKAGCQVITRRIAICAFISNDASCRGKETAGGSVVADKGKTAARRKLIWTSVLKLAVLGGVPELRD